MIHRHQHHYQYQATSIHPSFTACSTTTTTNEKKKKQPYLSIYLSTYIISNSTQFKTPHRPLDRHIFTRKNRRRYKELFHDTYIPQSLYLLTIERNRASSSIRIRSRILFVRVMTDYSMQKDDTTRDICS